MNMRGRGRTGDARDVGVARETAGPDAPGRPHRLDTPWLVSWLCTALLVGMVAVAVGAGWSLTIVIVGISGIGFGFFYLLFPGGSHFGLTVANFLAIYACLFEFFQEANFSGAAPRVTMLARALPVLGFLAGCVASRERIHAVLQARRVRDLDLNHLPRLMRWFAATMAVGAASFALPRLHLDPSASGIALLAAMAVVALFVTLAARDVVTVLVDVSLVFAAVAARIDRLIMPVLAFLTLYGLLVVVFTCLYRIADLTMPDPQFALHGAAIRISFSDALYYSVATITTLGFGDIAPSSSLVRALTGIEVVCGVLMLLFGFSEIMRGSGASRE
jgi:voltage-gated potassium channel